MRQQANKGYVSKSVVGGAVSEHKYVFAAAPIAEGELVAAWAGEIVGGDYVRSLGRLAGRTTVQIEEDLFLVSSGLGLADWINHSCDPNLGMRGQIVLVARRPIATGEELCLDYAMTDGSGYDEFDCECGAVLCRGRVSGSDWQRSELQARYRGYFSPYLEQRIAAGRKAA